MTKYFSPFSYLFLILYFIFLVSLFTMSDFFVYWTIMEFTSLVFMGMSFSVFTSGYSQLMTYFLIQALASLLIFISFTMDSSIFFTLSIVLKLSMFPFHFWFMNLMVRFSNFILLMTMTLHKIPSIIMLFSFSMSVNMSVLLSSMVLSSFVSGVMMMSALNLRYLLILSSVGNNSWFIISQFISIYFFMMFISIYFFMMFMVFHLISNSSKESFTHPTMKSSLSLLIISVSGLPPFPLFYLKLYLVFQLLGIGFDLVYFSLFLFFSSFMLIGYISFTFKYYSNVYKNSSILLMTL